MSHYDKIFCDAPLDDDNRIAERADELLVAYRTDPDKIAEADEVWGGMLGGNIYAEIESALADLHAIPADRLIGSDALAWVLRLADLCASSRDTALRNLAETDARAEADEARRITDDIVTEAAVARYEESQP